MVAGSLPIPRKMSPDFVGPPTACLFMSSPWLQKLAWQGLQSWSYPCRNMLFMTKGIIQMIVIEWQIVCFGWREISSLQIAFHASSATAALDTSTFSSLPYHLASQQCSTIAVKKCKQWWICSHEMLLPGIFYQLSLDSARWLGPKDRCQLKMEVLGTE